MSNDLTTQIQQQVQQAVSDQQPISIHGSGSHDFFQPDFTEALSINLSQHKGIIDYQPTELNIKARSGTPIIEIQQALLQQQQRLATDFPAYSDNSTLGGLIAMGHTGSSRPFQGALRDHVLGAGLIDGRGEILKCGGQVMKNVAGYDVSRLLCGSRGTLGPILDITLKVLPVPEQSITLCLEMDESSAIEKMNQMAGQSLPIAASLFYQQQLYLRLEGTGSGINHAQQQIGGELLADGETFWSSIQNQQHEFFRDSAVLWRVILPTTQQDFSLQHQKECLIDWCGGLRWIKAEQLSETDLEKLRDCGGSISAFRHFEQKDILPTASQLSPLSRKMQLKIKQAFDPRSVFNPKLSMFFYHAS